MWGGYWFEVAVDDYIVNFDGTVCAFCISDSGDQWLSVLGDSFMRNYYIVHDMDTMETGIAPLASAPITKAAGVLGSIPDCEFTDACAGAESQSQFTEF